MSDMVRNGCHHGVVEISSHALDQHRCTALQLSVAAITNVTQDHFDYHQSAGSYRAAKALIANLLHCDAPLLLNADDPGCQQLVRDSSIHAPIIWYGTTDQAELQADLITRTHRSQRIKLRLAQGSAEVRLRLIGQHNVSNALAAAAMAEQLGIEISSIVAGLESVSCIPGRMQRIDEGQPFQVLVDYAHTPDAISRCLQTVRQFTPGRLHCVFGAGGDRDRSKRPLMAAAASVADVVYVTSDNPRTEDPWQIIRDVEAGFDQGQSYICEVDRRSAIKQAFETAEPGDVVVIAGRGHEQVQVVGTQQHTFDDRQVARLLLNEIFDNAQVAGIRRFFSTVRSS
jgi:UDP-N-acetylmuramoyl-L-alanyl-D-glutamate--2,6-diaminopimelate ligase